MKLIRGQKYKHVTASGTNVCVYSHSDQENHNHFFTVLKNDKKWELDSLNQVSIPTWDLHRNMSPVDETLPGSNREILVQILALAEKLDYAHVTKRRVVEETESLLRHEDYLLNKGS